MGLLEEPEKPKSGEEAAFTSPPGRYRNTSSTANLDGLFEINSTPNRERFDATEKLISSTPAESVNLDCSDLKHRLQHQPNTVIKEFHIGSAIKSG